MSVETKITFDGQPGDEPEKPVGLTDSQWKTYSVLPDNILAAITVSLGLPNN